MRPLSAKRVLEVWERGEGGQPHDVGSVALSVALDRPLAEIGELAVGTRDALLLTLRERTLGPTLNGRALCPECGAAVDFALSVQDFADLTPTLERPAGDISGELEADGAMIRYRLPTAADLSAAAGCRSIEEARELLLVRCVLAVEVGGKARGVEALSERAVEALSERLEVEDPMAELPLAVQCARCESEWTPLLDIGSFFWAEISSLAERLMNDVHVLARTYGWSEDAILRMSSARRQFYLELGV